MEFPRGARGSCCSPVTQAGAHCPWLVLFLWSLLGTQLLLLAPQKKQARTAGTPLSYLLTHHGMKFAACHRLPLYHPSGFQLGPVCPISTARHGLWLQWGCVLTGFQEQGLERYRHRETPEDAYSPACEAPAPSPRHARDTRGKVLWQLGPWVPALCHHLSGFHIAGGQGSANRTSVPVPGLVLCQAL